MDNDPLDDKDDQLLLPTAHLQSVSLDLSKGDKDLAKYIREALERRLENTPDGLVGTEDQMIDAIQEGQADYTDALLLRLVDQGLINMSVDEHGEPVFFSAEKEKD